MPNYDYFCKECGHEREEFQKITDEPLIDCPICSKQALQRKVGGGAATLRFTGSGFYKTDYAAKEGTPPSPSNSCCPCGKNGTSCEN